ncbi:MAG: transglutaminase-like domain-containing protein [Oscillospiraceae bacterium]
MKSAKKPLVCASLVVGTDIRLTAKQRRRGTDLFRVALVWLTTVSFFYVFTTGSAIALPPFPFLFVTAVFAALFCGFRKKHPAVNILLAAVLAVIALLFYFTRERIVSGAYLVANKYFSAADVNYPQLAKLAKRAARAFTTNLNWFVSAAAFVVTGVVSAASFYLSSFPLLFLFTFPFLELVLFWGLVPSELSFFAAIICWIAAIAKSLYANPPRRQKGQSFLRAHRKPVFYLVDKATVAGTKRAAASWAAAAGAVTIALVLAFSALFSYQRPESFNAARHNMKTAFHKIESGDFWNGLNDLTGGFGDLFTYHDSASPNPGKPNIGGTALGTVNELRFTDASALKLTTTDGKHAVYLRANVCGDYHDNAWSQFDDAAYDPIGKLFADSAYSPQTMIYDYTMLTTYTQTYQMTINLTGARPDYAFLPYYAGLGDNNGFTPFRDSYVTGGQTAYTVPYINTDLAETDLIFNHAIEPFLSYEQYVKKAYTGTGTLNLSDEKKAVGTIDYDAKSRPYALCAADAISAYFRKNFTYTLNPGATPAGEDFVEYFLNEQKKGYCMYFATAGVMMLRSYGIPARYADGYVVTESQFKANSDGTYTAEVTDRSAHAWAEIYLEGTGWVPYDFTPGFDNQTNPNITTTTPKATTSHTGTTTKKPSGTTTKKNNASSAATTTSGTVAITKFDPNSAVLTASGVVLLSLLFIAICTAAVILRRSILYRKIQRKVFHPNADQTVVNCYRLALRYLSLVGIEPPPDATDLSAAEAIAAEFEAATENKLYGDFERLTDCALRVDMGGGGMTDEDVKNARDVLGTIRTGVYQMKNPVVRFILRYVMGLY